MAGKSRPEIHPAPATSEKKEQTPRQNSIPRQNDTRKRQELAENPARALTASQRGETLPETDEKLKTKKPGAIHKKYLDLIKKLRPEDKKSYRKKMASLEASEIRGSSRILVQKSGNETGKQRILNLREEQTKRIAAYTSKQGPDSYILSYPPNHEYTIGLGEIFLCAKLLKIEKSDGTIIIAKRMMTPAGRHKGRLAFCTINEPHTYVATHTGDKVTILDNKERVDVNNKKAVQAFIRILDREEAARKKHAEQFKKTEEFYTSPNYTTTTGPILKIPKTNPDEIPGDKILGKIFKPEFYKKLTPKQKENIGIIIQEFRKANLPDGIIAAAIANAYAESGFRSIQSTCRVNSRGPNERGFYDSKGRLREDSWGLFQMNAPASVSMKRGMTEAQKTEVRAKRARFRKAMRNPKLNCRKVIKRIKSRRGAKLRAAAARGASIAELTALFTIHIEIPADRYRRGRQRGKIAMRMFKTIEPPRQNRLVERFDARPFKKNGVISWTNGQEKLILGSSSVSGVLHYHLSHNTARIGIGAYNAGNFFKYFLKHIWPRVKHFTPPKKVILVGFALNGIHTSGNADRVINRSIQRHKRIIEFLKKWGVEEVLIATNQPYGGNNSEKRRRLNEFNRRIRAMGLTNDSVDLAKKVAPEGHCLPGTLADGLHLNGKTGKMAAKMYEKA